MLLSLHPRLYLYLYLYVYQYLLSDDDEEMCFIILRQRAPCQAEECQRVLEEPFLEG